VRLRSAAVLVFLGLSAAGCAVLSKGTANDAPHVVPASEWGGTERPGGVPHRTITHLTVHHQGEHWAPGNDVRAYLRRLQQWSRGTKGWVDVPYHYIIGPDGTIYAGRSPSIAGDTNTEYDPHGHLQVMLLGNFEDQTPTPQQWDSAVKLLAHLLKVHDLSPASIAAHRHVSNQTVCPGENLMRRFEELRAAASGSSTAHDRARLPHYMSRPWRANEWPVVMRYVRR
jgi:hypothetical protein